MSSADGSASASGEGGGSSAPTAPQRSGGAGAPPQGNVGQPLATASPHCRYVFPEISALMKKLSEVGKAFEQQEAALKEGNEQLVRRRREEETQLAHERELEEQRVQLERKNHEDKMAWEKDNLERERRRVERMKAQNMEVRIQNEQGSRRAVIHVGGSGEYKTMVTTLTRYQDSLFCELVNACARGNENPVKIFIDRDDKHFRLILNFLRQGEEVLRGADLRNADEPLLHEILCEAKYYRLFALELLIQRKMIGLQTSLEFRTLHTKEHFFVTTAARKEPHPQGSKFITTREILLENKNLTGVEFDHVYFKHRVSFKGSILAGAKFRECIFEAAVNFTNADLCHASFDHCTGLELSRRFVLTGASMDDVTFNPPLQDEEH